MVKRSFFLFIAIAFFVGSVLLPMREAHAVIQLLALGEIVADGIGIALSAALRKAGETAVVEMTLGADGVWVAQTSAAAARVWSWFGIGSRVASELGSGAETGEIRQIEIPVTSTDVIPKAQYSQTYANGYGSAVAIESSGWKMKHVVGTITQGYFDACNVAAQCSVDGQSHTVDTATVFNSIDDLLGACNESLSHAITDPGVLSSEPYLNCNGAFNAVALDPSVRYDKIIRFDNRDFYYTVPGIMFRESFGDGNVLWEKCSYFSNMNCFDGFGVPVIFEPKDGSRRFIAGQYGLQADSTDPDFTPAELQAFKNPFRLRIENTDSSGYPTNVDIAVAGKNMRVVSVAQVSPTVTYARVLELQSGVVTSTKEYTFQNSTLGTVYLNNPEVDVGLSYDPSTGTGTGSGTGVQTITFPTDYARVGEAGAAADKVSTKLDQLVKVGEPFPDPVVPDSGDFKFPLLGDSFSGLLGWRLPGHVSECPIMDINVDLWGFAEHLVMDSHCQLVESNRSTFSAVFIVLWVLVALFIVLGA